MDGRPLRSGRGLWPIDLLRGFWSLGQGGLALFGRPEYAGKLRTPILLNIVVLTAVFFGMFFGFWELFGWATSGSWGWLDWMRPGDAATGVLAMLLAAVTVFLLSPVLIETVMGPFLDPIAATTERIHAGPAMQPIAIGTWGGIKTGLRSSAQVLAVQAIVLPLCLLLSLTGVGLILAFALAGMLNAVVWFDIPAARRGLGLRDRLRLVRHNWPLALGFGMAFQLGLLLPIFNFLLLTPAAAVAVSTLYFRFEKTPSRAKVPDRPLRGA